MSDQIRIGVYVEPREELTSENNTTKDILASEVGRSLGATFNIDITDYSGDANVQGYKDGEVNYREAIDSANTTDVSSETTANFVYIENTGYEYSSATVLGSSLDKSIKVMFGTTNISILPSGAGVAFVDPNSGIDCTNIHVRTVDNDGSDNASAGHLAVKFLVVD
jgi:hypothetical protein